MSASQFLKDVIWLTLALGDIIGPNFVALAAGAVEAAQMVDADLLAPSVGEVSALIHVFLTDNSETFQQAAIYKPAKRSIKQAVYFLSGPGWAHQK